MVRHATRVQERRLHVATDAADVLEQLREQIVRNQRLLMPLSLGGVALAVLLWWRLPARPFER